MKAHTDNILTSFFLGLLGGTIVRVIFLYVNQSTLDISIYKTFLIGLMIDSLVLSVLFLPTLFFLVARIHLSKYLWFILKLQRLYLFTVISLFLLSSFVDIFIFQIYHHRLNGSLIAQVLNMPFPMLFNMVQSHFSYEVLVIPLLLIIAYSCTCWHIPIEKIHRFFSKKIWSKTYKELPLKQQLQKILIPYLLIFIFTSFIYVPTFSSRSFDQIIYVQQKEYTLQAASKNSFLYLFQEVFAYESHYDGFRKDLMEHRHDFLKKDFQRLISENSVEFVENYKNFLKRSRNPKKEFQTKPHIVLLNVDSLSQRFLENENHLPYLKKMASDGAYFTDFYFHYGSSMNAFVSLLFGLPMIHRQDFFMDNIFKKTNKISLMNILEGEGYKSMHIEGCSYDFYNKKEAFYKYGGSIAIDKGDFTSSLDKEKYICIVDDHIVTQRALSEIKKFYQKMPTFTKITLNNLHFFGHIPHIEAHGHPKSFDVKKHCKTSKDPIYKEKVQNGLCYINFVVKDFVESLVKITGNNLIILLTGEHRSWYPIPYKQDSMQSMQVPLIILDKRGFTPKGVIDKVASHQDVAPTLLYMIGYEKAYPFLGRSLLDRNEKEGLTVFQDRGSFSFRTGKYLLSYYNKESHLFEITKDKIKVPLDNNDLRLRLEKDFKQYMAGLAMWNSIDHAIEQEKQ